MADPPDVRGSAILQAPAYCLSVYLLVRCSLLTGDRPERQGVGDGAARAGILAKMPHDERPAAYEKTGVHSKSELQLLVGDALSAGDAGRVRD